MAAYFPNKAQGQYLQMLLHKLDKIKQGEVIMCVDFNCIQSPVLDTTANLTGNSRKKLISTRKSFTKLIDHYDFYDALRTLHPSDRDYFFHSRAHNTYTRIDTFFLDRHLLARLNRCTVGDMTWSDHGTVYLEIHDAYQFKGRSTWRLNDSLLLNGPFEQEIRDALQAYFTTNAGGEASDDIVWSAHKAVVRGLFLRKASYLKKHHQTNLLDCHKQIALVSKQNKKQPTPVLASQLQNLHTKLTELNAEKTKTLLFKLKANVYHNSGKASKHLANRLRAKYASTKIARITVADDNQYQTPADISWEFAKFYSELYNLKEAGNIHIAKHDEIDEYLRRTNLPQVSQVKIADLLKPIDLQELLQVIEGLPGGKLPGADGLTNAYYKIFAN
ncbi:Hypothetical predicted protein [Pelobates cultripes]|uniref:Reverse transcriptase n=1 Tax=Pelobates cultripes TaxID=61616 RepID=A0AAD1TNF5_PELCU|nr:Hypothetical predicted protein [Pelobates cultripes]